MLADSHVAWFLEYEVDSKTFALMVLPREPEAKAHPARLTHTAF